MSIITALRAPGRWLARRSSVSARWAVDSRVKWAARAVAEGLELRKLLRSGLPSGHPGLRSSLATEFDTFYPTRLGYGDGFTSFDGNTSVDGLPVMASDVRAIWTFTGDMNLDRRVQNVDFTLFNN